MPSILVFYILYYHITYQLLNLLKIKSDNNKQDLTFLTAILSNLNNFHSLDVVDRVSETQLQVGEYFKLNNLAAKGLKVK